MSMEERLAAARERILSRYPDRDAAEVKLMLSHKGLTPEQLKERFLKATEERAQRVKAERDAKED